MLKTLREQAGLDRVVLARMGTMTVHQVRGLEEGEGGEFYSPEIKAHMGRTLLAKLGYVAPPAAPAAPAPASLSLPPEPPPASLPEAAPPGPRFAQAPSPPAYPRGRSERGAWRIAALGALVALAVGAYALVGPKPPRQPTAASAPAEARVPNAPGVAAAAVAVAPETPPEVPAATAPAPALATPSATVAPAVAVAAVAADPGCKADAAVSSVAYTPSEPRKAGNFVYVVADKPARLCVVDANRKATRVELEPGAGRSIYGAAPFVVRGDMGHLRIF
ncbi:MAG: hypothetical protein RIS88_2538, partial [Pseudomonadota bacterium]